MAKKGKPAAAPPPAGAKQNAPTPAEMDTYFDRLHEINGRLDELSGELKGDMNSIYDEGAKALGMVKEVFVAAFKEDRRKRKQEAKFAKTDSRTRDSFLLLATTYGEDSPLGQWARRMADAVQVTARGGEKKADADKPEAKEADADKEKVDA
jgi:hypothetical protein